VDEEGRDGWLDEVRLAWREMLDVVERTKGKGIDPGRYGHSFIHSVNPRGSLL
jgi:hypothetical protein